MGISVIKTYKFAFIEEEYPSDKYTYSKIYESFKYNPTFSFMGTVTSNIPSGDYILINFNGGCGAVEYTFINITTRQVYFMVKNEFGYIRKKLSKQFNIDYENFKIQL